MSGSKSDRIETADIHTGYVVASGLFFAGIAVGAGLLLHWVFGKGIRAQMRSATDYTIEAFPEPRLQKNPTADLIEYENRDRSSADSYSWKGDSRERAQIPVDRAMQIAIDRGLISSSSGKKGDAHR